RISCRTTAASRCGIRKWRKFSSPTARAAIARGTPPPTDERRTPRAKVAGGAAHHCKGGLLGLAGGRWRRCLRRRSALLAFQLLARFVGAALQLLLQFALLLLEDLGIGRRSVIGLGEIAERHHHA